MFAVDSSDGHGDPAQGIPKPTEVGNALEGDGGAGTHVDADEEGSQVVDVGEGVVQPDAVRPHGVHQADGRRLGG